MASTSTSTTWPFASTENFNKSTLSDTAGATSSSLSTLSSMLDDVDIWAEFKTELDARHLKTGLGIQGMLSKFVAEKRQTQLQEELEEQMGATITNINGNNGGDEVRDASNNNNLLRRISMSLSMAPSVTTDDTHQQHQAEQLLKPLSGRRGSVSHINIPEISNNNYHSRESEKSGKIEEMWLSRSCPLDIGQIRRGDNYNIDSEMRQNWSSHYRGMMEKGESTTSSEDVVTPNAISKNSLFKDWFGLVRDRGGKKSHDDQNKAKPANSRNEGNSNQKPKPASSRNAQHDNGIVIDSGPGLSEAARYFPMLEEQDTATQQRSKDYSWGHGRNQEGAAQDVNAVVPSQQSCLKPSCLKISSREASSLSQTGPKRNNDHSQLLRLLHYFGGGISEERANQVRSSPTTDSPIINQNVNNNEDQDQEVDVKKKKNQHQAPQLDPSTCKSVDSLSSNTKPASLHFKYEPRRKHASPIDKNIESTNMISSMENSKGIQRQRKVRTLQDNTIINRSSAALSTSSSDDTLELERRVHDMMSTGSIRDIKKRHIPSTNAESRNQDCSSISNIGNTASSNMRPPHMMMPSILSSMNNGKNSSSSMMHRPPHMMPSTNRMMSSGSSKDMLLRCIPGTTAAERQNQDWVATGSCNQMALLNPLNQQQQPQPSDNNASWNRQANVLITGNSTRDMCRRRIPTTAERQHQDWATGNGTLLNQQQQEQPSGNANHHAALKRICDYLKKRHKERKYSIIDNGPMIDSIDLRRRQMITKSRTMHEKEEENIGRVRGTTTVSSSSQIVQEKSNDNSNTGCTGTDLFRRYLENKARNSTTTTTSKPASSNKDETPPALLANGSPCPRGSKANTPSVGQLLVEWGDTTQEEDENNVDENDNINSEMPNDCVGPCIPKKKEQQEETIFWPGSFDHMVENCYITINHNEAAFRRVSDITTYSSAINGSFTMGERLIINMSKETLQETIHEE